MSPPPTASARCAAACASRTRASLRICISPKRVSSPSSLVLFYFAAATRFQVTPLSSPRPQAPKAPVASRALGCGDRLCNFHRDHSVVALEGRVSDHPQTRFLH
jgi:hypothetical protein